MPRSSKMSNTFSASSFSTASLMSRRATLSESGWCVQTKIDLNIIFRLSGSVFPKASFFALPSAVAAYLLWWVFREETWMQFDPGASLWSSYNTILGVLIVFRTNQAYSRYWEGATLLQQVRGEWFNAVSSLFAFCTPAKQRRLEVETFQHQLIRLMSMLYCSALQQISQMESTTFEVLELKSFDQESLSYLRTSMDRTAVICHWIQRLLVENHRSEVIDIDAPILSRVYQELSRGMVKVNDVRKIFEFLFPFPYAQMITVLLQLHFCFTPIICGLTLNTPYWSGSVAFISIFALWSLNFVAAELENPFGDDANDLPMHGMMRHMNETVLLLLDPRAQVVPEFIDFKDAGYENTSYRVTTMSGHSRRLRNSNAMNDTLAGRKGFTGFDENSRKKKTSSKNTRANLRLRFSSLRETLSGRPTESKAMGSMFAPGQESTPSAQGCTSQKGQESISSARGSTSHKGQESLLSARGRRDTGIEAASPEGETATGIDTAASRKSRWQGLEHVRPEMPMEEEGGTGQSSLPAQAMSRGPTPISFDGFERRSNGSPSAKSAPVGVALRPPTPAARPGWVALRSAREDLEQAGGGPWRALDCAGAGPAALDAPQREREREAAGFFQCLAEVATPRAPQRLGPCYAGRSAEAG